MSYVNEFLHWDEDVNNLMWGDVNELRDESVENCGIASSVPTEDTFPWRHYPLHKIRGRLLLDDVGRSCQIKTESYRVDPGHG